jgi:hypothetical protein
MPPTAVETSPLGDEREHEVPCRACLRPTLNFSARCDAHLDDA